MRTRQRIALIAAACVVLAASALPATAADDGEDFPHPRIVGGTQAAPGAYPFVVAVVDHYTPNPWHGARCGGSVIHPEWVLTAASCVHGSQPGRFDVVAVSWPAGQRVCT